MRKSILAGCVLTLASITQADTGPWNGHAGDAQHTGMAAAPSQALDNIHWKLSVDSAPGFSFVGELITHYGSLSITPANTVIVPVKTGSNSFKVSAFNGATGTPLWTQATDYKLPPSGSSGFYNWTPSYSPALATGNTLYYAGDGGTVYKRSALDVPGAVTPAQEAFFGPLSTYAANQRAYNIGVGISTPITADKNGNIYFGYQTTDSAPGGLTSGIARISAAGVGTFFQANQLTVSGFSARVTQVVTNCAPALSNDGSTVYVAMSNGSVNSGRLVALNSTTLLPTTSVALLDARTGDNAWMPNDGTASPMVGPDGDVYMGVADTRTSRGWMDHFSANLSQTKISGGYGWDDTPSVVPASMVPGYTGSSSYLLVTDYNNFAESGGGDGKNMIAILDPNASQIDTRINSNTLGGEPIMKVVESILGPTPDATFGNGAVHAWCTNTAAVDPATDSILVNSEDGFLYRWSLASNTLSEKIQVSSGLQEASTPTEIGPDGTVYAINNSTLVAVGVPEPHSILILALGTVALMARRSRSTTSGQSI